MLDGSRMLTPGRSVPRPSWLMRREDTPELVVLRTKPHAELPMRPLAVVRELPVPVVVSQTNTPDGVAMKISLPTATTSSTISLGSPLADVMESIQSLVV